MLSWVLQPTRKSSVAGDNFASKDGTGLTQYCIGQILLETGRAKEAEAKFLQILSGRLGEVFSPNSCGKIQVELEIGSHVITCPHFSIAHWSGMIECFRIFRNSFFETGSKSKFLSSADNTFPTNSPRNALGFGGHNLWSLYIDYGSLVKPGRAFRKFSWN